MPHLTDLNGAPMTWGDLYERHAAYYAAKDLRRAAPVMLKGQQLVAALAERWPAGRLPRGVLSAIASELAMSYGYAWAVAKQHGYGYRRGRAWGGRRG